MIIKYNSVHVCEPKEKKKGNLFNIIINLLILPVRCSWSFSDLHFMKLEGCWINQYLWEAAEIKALSLLH